MPRRIVLVDEIPKGPTGKVQRIGLAERLGVDTNGTAAVTREPYRFLETELIAIWESVLDLSDLGVNDDFFALGGDSILGAEAVARMRDLVGDPNLPLVSIVRAPTPAAMALEVFAGVGVGDSGVVPLQASGSRTPLFLVHGGDGEVLAFAVLARRLGRDQPSYGLRARGIDGDTPPQSSLVEMAAEYVADIRRVRPHGPYVLGGFCLGGAIAIEMASQLSASGEEVTMLALLDPRFPRPKGLRYALWLARRRTAQRQLVRAIGRRLARRLKGSTSGLDESVATAGIATTLAHLRESYEPQSSSLPAVVILSEQFEEYDLPMWYLRKLVARPLRWRRLTGDHVALLLPPTVDVVASEIRTVLDEAAGSRSSA